MRSAAATVDEYLESLPEDRREVISAIRRVILDRLPEGYEEAMNWGMISYQVPLATYPDTYNGQPLMYAALAAQKRHYAVYLTGVYADPAALAEFTSAYEATGKPLDMGKSCVRFTRLDDLPLDVIGDVIGAVEVGEFIAMVERARD
jgi:hypothetical protein